MKIAEYKEQFRLRLAKYRPEVVLYEEKASWTKHVNESSSHGIFGTASRSVSFDVCIPRLTLVGQTPLVRLHV